MTSLPQAWIDAKADEVAAIEKRRAIEDAMIKQGVTEVPGYKIKIVERQNWKVDIEKLQSLAEANDLISHVQYLFRWKAEVDQRAWNAANPKIINPLMPALTISPGRPSFTITKE